MCVRVGNLTFHDWVSLELPGGWSDTFIFRMSPTDGLPPADYAGVVRAVAVPLRKLRPSASIWVQICSKDPAEGCRAGKPSLADQSNGERGANTSPSLGTANWFQAEVRFALRGVQLPVAVSGGNAKPQLWNFSFFPQVDPRPYPPPPAADPLLKEGTFRRSEWACLRVLARSDCAFTAEVASLANLSRTGARGALRRLNKRRLITLNEAGQYPLWEIRRPGLSLALRSWGLPPGLSFRRRKERGRDACVERVSDRRWEQVSDGPKKWVSITGKRPISFRGLDRTTAQLGNRRSSRGRHRRTARLWPAWLRRAWPHAEVWAGWTEVASGRGRPDALCWGRVAGCETLFWLEVESGHDSRAKAVQKTLRRVNQALLYARRGRIRMVFVLLGLPWVLHELADLFHPLPDDLAVVAQDWKAFGHLPAPSWGKLGWR